MMSVTAPMLSVRRRRYRPRVFDSDMSRSRVALLYAAWLFVAAFIGVVTAIVLTELLRVIGLVDSGEESYQRAINVTWLVVFVAVAGVPWVFRNRFTDGSPPDQP